MRDFTNYDYNTLVEAMTEALADKPGWGDGYQSSTGQTLIQLVADMTDHLFYMLERRSQESFLETARLDSSIRARASELGYRPRRKISSTGTVLLELVDDNGNAINAQGNIEINKGTFLTADDENFVTTEDRVIPVGSSSVEIPIKEGIEVVRQYNFDTEPFVSDPTIVIDSYEAIEEFSLEVLASDGIYYDVGSLENQNINVTSLAYATSDDQLYDIKFAREGMRLVFGDGEFGKKPTGNVQVTWVQSSGGNIDVLATGLEFVFEDEFLTDDQNILPQQLYRYRMNNITPIRGGRDEESSADIARNAPLSVRTANRAITADDYEFWALRSGIGNIVDVNAFGEQESGILIYNMNNVYLVYITEDELPLNVEQQDQLREFLDRYKSVTTHLIIKEADKVEIVLDIDFQREQTLPITNEQLYRVLRDFIHDYFRIKRGTINSDIQHSEFVKFLQGRTFRFNGINYPITDFVKVRMVAQYPMSIPFALYDVQIWIDPSYTYVENDVWTISLNDQDVSVVVEAGDDLDSMLQKMSDAVFAQTNIMTAVDDQKLRLKSPYIDETFTLDLTQGDLSAFVQSDHIFQIPPSILDNPTQKDLILPGSAYVIDQDETVLFEDDGNGLMVDVNNVLPSFGIDYANCTLLSPSLPQGEYYIRYLQNPYQTFEANANSALVLSPLAETINDVPLFSKLRLL